MTKLPHLAPNPRQQHPSNNELNSIERLLAQLSVEQVRTVRILLKMLVGRDVGVEARSEVLGCLREVLEPHHLGKVSTSIAISQEVQDRVASYRKSVGEKVYRLRKRAGLTQEQLAKKANLPQSHLSRIESGRHAPSYVTMSRIAIALNADPAELDPGA